MAFVKTFFFFVAGKPKERIIFFLLVSHSSFGSVSNAGAKKGWAVAMERESDFHSMRARASK